MIKLCLEMLFENLLPVPSPEKRGGLGMGPATPPRKNSLATETETREKTASGGRREATGNWIYEGWGPNPQGSLHPDGGSPYTQNFYQHRMLECENTISDRKTGTGSPRNAPIQN